MAAMSQTASTQSPATPCMAVLDRFSAPDVPAMGPAEAEAPIGTWTNSVTPAGLPGKGLAQHPFFYTGEWDYRKANQTIFVVRGGHVVWTYSIYKGRSNNRPRNAA